jgi:hypothetical protein
MNLHAVIYKRLVRDATWIEGGWVFLGVDQVTQMDVICWHERVWVPNLHVSIYGRPVV